MIALEFIGTITEDAQIITTVDNKKEITFPVDVKRGIDKNGLDKSIVIYCKKKGTCSSDKRRVPNSPPNTSHQLWLVALFCCILVRKSVCGELGTRTGRRCEAP